MCRTASYYDRGKDPTFAFGTAMPFDLNVRQHNAWMYQGGGMEPINAFYATHTLVAFPAGNTGAQRGGWFRKEINSVNDLKGLKFRIAGFSGKVAKWNELPKSYQAIVMAGSQTANRNILATYDHRNPAALKRLAANGAVLRPFPQDVMEACFGAARDSYAEIGAGKRLQQRPGQRDLIRPRPGSLQGSPT
jgi:TRAP-type mannitol/chloroaromatic compound transport system substrate-binding protein